MPTVTAIKQQQKRADRYSIFIDGKYSFSLSDTQLVDSGLASGQELSDAKIEEYQAASEYGKALRAAYNLLSYRARSRHELSDRLARKGYDEETVENVINRLIELKLINDEDFAASLLRQPQSKLRSTRRLQQELYKKGIDRQISEQSIQELGSQHDYEAIKERIEKHLQKKSDPDRARLIAMLSRQGFRVRLILDVLNQEFSEIR